MKTRTKLISVAVAATLLLSGCGGVNSPSGSEREKDVTTSAAEATSTPVDTTAETTTAASTTTAVTEVKTETDIMRYTLNQLNGKSINCENRSSLHMNSTDDWKLQPGDAPQLDYDGNNPYFEFKHDSYRFTPQARYSSGAMSKECDDAFRTAVKSTENTSGNIGGGNGYQRGRRQDQVHRKSRCNRNVRQRQQ